MSTIIKKAQSEHVKQYYDNIEKSRNDKKAYRGLVLSNDMKVLLISDPTTEKSAAALRVNVGAMSDPIKFCGLAHFLEHMLFLGTEKYPDRDDYDQYLSQVGGSSNASTGRDNTIYQFAVLPDHFDGALDRFVQFFIKPLFDPSATEREVNAVNSEFENEKADDDQRLQRLMSFSGDPSHPYSQFTGNKKSLLPEGELVNLRNALIEFFDNWYSSNIMSLTVLGQESLDELEKMVVERFTEIKNKNVIAPTWPEHPFKPEHYKKKWFIVPSGNTSMLRVIFPVPDVEEDSKFIFAGYIASFVEYKDHGSLYSALEKKGWGNSVTAYPLNVARGACKFFVIDVELTDDGVDHVDDIITLIFQYINFVKKEGVVEWIFQEYKQLQQIAFDYAAEDSPIGYVVSKVTDLMNYPMEKVLTSSSMPLNEWDPEFLHKYVLDQLTPENIRIYVISEKYQNTTTETEPWFDVKFRKENIPEKLISIWQNCGISSDFSLQTKNEFIPQDFTIKADGKTVIDQFPTIIKNTPLMRLWFKQDDEFLLPKVYLSLNITSPVVSATAEATNFKSIYTRLMSDSMEEYAFNAQITELEYTLMESEYGITLNLSGYHDTYAKLLYKIIDKMVHFKIDEKTFEILKEGYFEYMKDFETNEPLDQASYYQKVLLQAHVWENEELLNASEHATFECLKNFVSEFFTKFHIELLLYGNLTKEEALETGRIVESKFAELPKPIVPLLPKDLMTYRQIDLKTGFTFRFTVENYHHRPSATVIYYQNGLESTESNVKLKLLLQIISKKFFIDLRTEQQLGYIVRMTIKKKNGVQGLVATIKGDQHPTYVESRIEKFMEKMLGELTFMKSDEFEGYKATVVAKLSEKPEAMTNLMYNFREKITSRHYNFDDKKLQLEYIKTVTQDQVVLFFKNLVEPETRSKLAIHVVSKVYDEFTQEIKDIDAFKSNQSLYPLLQPLVTIPDVIV